MSQDQQKLQYTVVFSDPKDVTHFREEHLMWEPMEGPADLLLATPFLDASKIGFLRIPKGYRADFHPAPSKRFVMVLSGAVEIKVGDGERRRFAAGSVVLVTDTECRGHCTNALDNQEVFLAWVPVP